jgi:hypothetical protein
MPTGENQYLNRIQRGALDDQNQLLTDVVGSDFCANGAVVGSDATMNPIRRVRFAYRSDGTVQKENSKSVKGEFNSVDLTLVIEENDTPVYQQSVTSACSLKARVRKSGERSKARLRCDLGADFSSLGLDTPANAEFLRNVDNAFPKLRGSPSNFAQGVNLKTEKGRLRVRHNGELVPEGASVLPLGCSDPDD